VLTTSRPSRGSFLVAERLGSSHLTSALAKKGREGNPLSALLFVPANRRGCHAVGVQPDVIEVPTEQSIGPSEFLEARITSNG
jgi:hypothetical protein